jgi:DNA ligase D-like protein (predicted ligase)
MSDWYNQKISPMLASSGKPFDSKEHLFEIKWDGIRTLAFFGGGKARLQSRKLTDSTIRYPEIREALRELPGEGVLDGEIIVLKDGKPSFESVLEREQVRTAEKALLRARHQPAIYMVFDVLYLAGRRRMDDPLVKRREVLSEFLGRDVTGVIVESTFILERGADYYREAVNLKLEGIMAKELESPYVPGARTNSWIKIKASHTIDCVVLGTVVEPASGRVRSLVLGTFREGAPIWMGNVGSGLDSRTLEALATELVPLAGDRPEGLEVSSPGVVRWLRPALVARVKYLELTREGRLRAPVFVGFVDSPPESCEAPWELDSRQ